MTEYYTKTKIIATMGPAVASIDKICELVKSGVNIIRLNFSHDNHEIHQNNINNIREAEKIIKKPIPILVDLCGPKIRLGQLSEDFDVVKGDNVTITTDDIIGSKGMVSTIYKNLPQDVKVGDVILIDDGLIELRVSEIKDNNVICKAVNNGRIKSKKGMNLPHINISTPSLTQKDKKDVDFAIKNNVDFMALSFVRSKTDITDLKSYINAHGKYIPIVAKIEKPEAIEVLDEIIVESDMLMVARGDLGVETGTEDVPFLQKLIIERSNFFNKPVITATQMLESMVKNPRPTRAEASDVANAVLDNTDAVMLSAETSVGEYPVDTVRIMKSIIDKAELRIKPQFINEREKEYLSEDLAKSACQMALNAKAAAIITITKTGRTPKLLSKYRVNTPIIAFTENPKTINLMSIYWGVYGELIDTLSDTDTLLKKTTKSAMDKGYIKPGDIVVYVVGIPLLEVNHPNMIKLDRV